MVCGAARHQVVAMPLRVSRLATRQSKPFHEPRVRSYARARILSQGQKLRVNHSCSMMMCSTDGLPALRSGFDSEL